MDSWSERQLKLMWNGGNRKLQEFLSNYDLMTESVMTRYSTRAADYYRENLKSKVDKIAM